jgi:hypothetical protein
MSINGYNKFEILTAVTNMKSTTFWVMIMCSVVDVPQQFTLSPYAGSKQELGSKQSQEQVGNWFRYNIALLVLKGEQVSYELHTSCWLCFFQIS